MKATCLYPPYQNLSSLKHLLFTVEYPLYYIRKKFKKKKKKKKKKEKRRERRERREERVVLIYDLQCTNAQTFKMVYENNSIPALL